MLALLAEDGASLLTEGDDEIMAGQALFDAVIGAVVTALEAALPDVPIERGRRAPVDIEERPRVILLSGGAVPDETQSPFETFWTFSFAVGGYVVAATDAAAEVALMELHALVIGALSGVEIGGATIEATSGPASFDLYGADGSAPAAGDFNLGFTALAMAPTGQPFTA